MEFVFESTGSTAGLENWLKAFKEISPSLLIEIDATEQKFVAKTFTSDKTIVKFGQLSFSDANLTVSSVISNDTTYTADEWASQSPVRIKIGITAVLDKFIKVINMFSGSNDCKITVFFSSDANGDFIAQRIRFKSLALEMVVGCSDVDDFVYITDDKFFNGISLIENPMTFNITADINKKLYDASAVLSTTLDKDIIDFTVSKDGDDYLLRAVDHESGKYNFKMSYISEAQSPVEVNIPVSRSNYLLATKNDGAESVITICGQDGASKMKIASGSNFVTIIAAIRV